MSVSTDTSIKWSHNYFHIQYGLLYNWYAIDNAAGISPTGWHVPTLVEWQTLVSNYDPGHLGVIFREVGITHWRSASGTNTTGLTILGSGTRTYSTGSFSSIKETVYLGSSTNYNTDFYDSLAIIDHVLFGNFLSLQQNIKKDGLVIRCIRDTNVGWSSGEQVVDYDGNRYDTVQIGTQIWTVQNLAVTHYRNGTSIPEVTDNSAWTSLTTGALCAYNNDWSNVYI